VSYLLTVYISRTFGNETLGYFSFLLSYSLIFLLFLKSGTDIYLMKWTSRYVATDEKGKAVSLYYKLLTYHITAGLILTTFCIVCTPFILNTLFSQYRNIQFFEIGLISLFFMNLHILNYEFLRGSQRLISYTFYHTVSIFLLTILLNISFEWLRITSDHQLESAYLIAVVISFFLSFIHVQSVLRHQHKASSDRQSILLILKDSFPFFSNNAVLVLIGTIDVFILSNYVSPSVIGEYALMVKIATFVSFPLVVLGANFSPKIAAFDSHESLQKSKHRVVRSIALFSLILFMLILLILQPAINFLNIHQIKSNWIFLIIGAGFVISSAFALNEACLQMMGEEKLYQKIMLLACLFNFILNLLLIPIWKEVGAALASMLTLLSWNLAASYYAHKKLKISTF
jgi:O-antigen/teichoic acid export membrane protein